MCYKDLLTICEGLGSCWSLYFRFEQTHLTASLILMYGNDLQKSCYLPQIASGVIRPVIGFSASEMSVFFTLKYCSLFPTKVHKLRYSDRSMQSIGFVHR